MKISNGVKKTFKYIFLSLVVIGLALVGTTQQVGAIGTVVVSTENMNGWWFFQETATGSGTFVYGPSTPPLGGGSAQLTVNGTGGELFGTFAFVGTRLDAITSLGYSTYRTSGSSALAASLQFDIDTNVTDANIAWQGRLVYEPYYTHTVSTGVWQTWNPLDNAGTGNWWFTGAPGNAVCTLNNPCTWSELRAAFPNAGIRSAGANTGALQFKAGGGWTSGFVGSVDALSIGVNSVVTTYDFELPFTVPTITSISPSFKQTSDSAFTLTVNGTNFFSSSTVQWNGVNRATTFVSATQLTASISASDIALANALPVTIMNPAPGGGISNSQTLAITIPTAYTAWSDQGVAYTAPSSGDAYYPSVIYDTNGFGGVQKYAMWYTDGLGGTFLVKSSDGAIWGTPTTMIGLSNAHHVQVLYDAACFGTLPCNAGTTKYQIWFWDMGANLYSIGSMARAESADGINWINKTAATQNSSAKLTQDPDTGSGWNRGTYGPVSILYQSTAANTGSEPWNYRYVMYYNGTDGGREYTGLAYSIDGLMWSAYTVNPVLSGTQLGGIEAWDCVSAVYGTVFSDASGFHYFFSGSGQDNGSGGCGNSSSFTGIGYASSVDGKTWVKNTNPIFHISDGVSYRSGRIYTPSVINDGSGILRMYFSVRASSGAKKIAYATLIAPSTSESTVTPPPIISLNNNTLTVVEQVQNDSGGTAIFSDFSLFIDGNPVESGESRRLAPGVYVITETNRPGYTVNFTGDCDANGRVALGGLNSRNLVCTVVNNDIGSPSPDNLVKPPLIDIIKVPSPLALPEGPGLVTYTYTVTNIGIVPMTDISLLGDICRPIVFISGDTNNDSKLDVGEKWIYKCTTNLTETTRNTVVAIGQANGLTASHITNATVVVGAPILPPLIHVIKIPDPLALLAWGGIVTYNITVTNPGVIALTNVGVLDDRCGLVKFISGDINNDSKLDSVETWKYTCQANLTETMTNTVIVAGLANGLVATDFALATVVVAIPALPNTGLFTRDQKLGARGSDVMALQQYLNANGYIVASSGVGSLGNETDYFGGLTQRALIKFQKANHISPAIGYFGRITQGVINRK